MAGTEPTHISSGSDLRSEPPPARPGRSRMLRLLVPVGVAGLAAATIGLVPALADAGNPDLPKISAQELLTKLAAADDSLSGSVRINTDLGLPGLVTGDSATTSGYVLGSGARADDGTAKNNVTADPKSTLTELLAGKHTLRVAADGAAKQRVAVVDDLTEYNVVHNGSDLWAYDSETNQAYHATLPEQQKAALPEGMPATPEAAAKQALAALDPTTSVSVDGTTRVAGQDAYQLLIKPDQADSTIGSIRIAVDSGNGVPLKFTLTPKGGGKAAVDIAFTDVDFGKPAADTFKFTPPSGARTTEKKLTAPAPSAKPDFKLIGKGWTAVAKLKLPDSAGRARTDGAAGGNGGSADLAEVLRLLGDRVSGDFGTGTVVHTRLINVLITSSGDVYAGAVAKDALVAAAEQA